MYGLGNLENLNHFILYQMPFVTLPFYVVMVGVRGWVWLRFYNPALKLLPGAWGSVFQIWQRQYRPTIHLFPRKQGPRGLEWGRFFRGFFLFSGLWKRDRILWIGSWSLHLGLALFALAHVRFALPRESVFNMMLVALTGFSCWVMTLSGVYLLVRRLLVQRVREITDFRDYLAELLLLVFSFTALMVSQTGGVSVEDAHAYLAALLGGMPVLESRATPGLWTVSKRTCGWCAMFLPSRRCC